MNTLHTLVTGATSGIGKHLAFEFAAHDHALVLVAPDFEELKEVASHIRANYGVEVQVIAADLEQESSFEEISAELAASRTEIGILVNNAGHGFRGLTWETSLEQDLSMIRLNIEAVVRLTKMFLPAMIARGKGRILNTASVAGFEPGPLLNVYHSTKAFVLSYSEALAVESAESGVVVTALCPGPTGYGLLPQGGHGICAGIPAGQGDGTAGSGCRRL